MRDVKFDESHKGSHSEEMVTSLGISVPTQKEGKISQMKPGVEDDVLNTDETRKESSNKAPCESCSEQDDSDAANPQQLNS